MSNLNAALGVSASALTAEGAAAVRELLKLGLTGHATEGGGMKSSNYGVFRRGPDGHTHASD